MRTAEDMKESHDWLIEHMNEMTLNAVKELLIYAYERGYEDGYDDCEEDENANESFLQGWHEAFDDMREKLNVLTKDPAILKAIEKVEAFYGSTQSGENDT